MHRTDRPIGQASDGHTGRRRNAQITAGRRAVIKSSSPRCVHGQPQLQPVGPTECLFIARLDMNVLNCRDKCEQDTQQGTMTALFPAAAANRVRSLGSLVRILSPGTARSTTV